ncbi:MAG: phosphoenolpyruvate carboxykinase (GTP) [Candidatus Omnitrophica bacterium]|nr:phosphoenolpyruvate carboxykinase (GTP) [Candidatus Omnitrophota bacterium]MDD4013744.1 phosphoenolpyruvate carboxykinase (GTP) [Candidatus Omnitrophota bacterium]
MRPEQVELLKKKCGEENYKKLAALDNPKMHDFVAKYVEICDPDSVFVGTDSPDDAEYVRKKALVNGEEKPLKIQGQTVHFDGYFDQGRDKFSTRYLLRHGQVLGSDIEFVEREEGLNEVNGRMKDSMAGKEMLVMFFCLGPTNSQFAIPAVQITDSAYVGHSEGILYRSGYEEFRKIGDSGRFFRFAHSAGKLNNGVSLDVYGRRVYIDLEDEMVMSVNTQYAGNTVGLKKLAMRLAIKRASEEGWLTEHMFIMGVKGLKDQTRTTYFTGSFPSACGKTATAMLEGETIIGDDIAYLRRVKGKMNAVNVESGIFGIIQDVSEKSDPAIYKALTTPGEVIFSNILVTNDNSPRWLGDGKEMAEAGINFSGYWFPGKKGPDDNEILPAHKNARYTIRIKDLENCDKNLDNPDGVELGGVIYGGRDSDTTIPVQEAFDWDHGILTMAATIESETTAATLGKEGVRVFNLMANLDFLSIPIGRYIQNNLEIVKGLKKHPRIFHVNYFLKGKDGKFLNGIKDKHVWLKWMDMRVNGEAQALKMPCGYMPRYEDLADIFKKVLGKEYSREQYEEQFKLRIPENIAKIDRIKNIYHTKVFDTPHMLMKALDEQRTRLEECRAKHGDYVGPAVFEKE